MDDVFNKLPFTDENKEFTYFRMDDFYAFLKKNNWEMDKIKTGNLLKRLDDIFVSEERVRIKKQQPRLIKIKTMKQTEQLFQKLNTTRRFTSEQDWKLRSLRENETNC